MRLRIAIAVLALLLPATAPAAWHQASSAHFVIYANQDPAKLKEFAVLLEKFDKAVRVVRSMPDLPPSQGNRLTIFVVPSEAAVRRLAQDKSGTIAGFYQGRATGSVAFVPRNAGTGEYELDAQEIFFHEYAHHLMFQDLSKPVPEWLAEGFAEFMSTAKLERDGAVSLGIPPHHRAFGLFLIEPVPLERLLAGDYGKLDSAKRETIYGRGWLMAHYLTFEHSRAGQLARYINGMAEGMAPLDAARGAFGDLKQFDKDLTAYLNRRRVSVIKVNPAALAIGPVEVTPLSAGAAAVMPLRMESKRGVNSETAEPLAVKVRKVAAQYAGDPLVEVTLAEAELDAGHADAAEAAADRALKIDPRHGEAMIYKGRAILERAAASERQADQLFVSAREWFIAANALDREDPEPLMLFYETFQRQGIQPSPNAVDALHYAAELAPQDAQLRMNSAVQYLVDGKLEKASKTLVPIAYDPHGGEAASVAREMIVRLKAGDGKGARQMLDEAAKAQAGASVP